MTSIWNSSFGAWEVKLPRMGSEEFGAKENPGRTMVPILLVIT